ncbi:MAG: 50S ribosomal protein L24 [Kiritimatiellae bacterium]|nr:50S ribosomal protein L24 [Kiritimatiellia bacterium]
MSTARIKKDDVVVAVAGRDAGKTGKVLAVNAKKGVAVVEGLNMVKKGIRKSDKLPNGQILDVPAPIALSNLQPYDAKAKKGVRVSYVREGDRSVRVAKGTGTRFA